MTTLSRDIWLIFSRGKKGNGWQKRCRIRMNKPARAENRGCRAGCPEANDFSISDFAPASTPLLLINMHISVTHDHTAAFNFRLRASISGRELRTLAWHRD